MKFHLLVVGTFFLSGSLHAAREIDGSDKRVTQSYERLGVRVHEVAERLNLSRSVASVDFLSFTIPLFHKKMLRYNGKELLKRDLYVPNKRGVQFVRHLMGYLKAHPTHPGEIVQKIWPLALVYNASEEFSREKIKIFEAGPCDNDHIIQLLERIIDTPHGSQDFVLHAVISAKAYDHEEPAVDEQEMKN